MKSASTVGEAISGLYFRGFSYTVLSFVSGLPIPKLQSARRGKTPLPETESVKRLERLEQVFASLDGRDFAVDPVALFESDIVLGSSDGIQVRATLAELWKAGNINDEQLAEILKTKNKLYSYQEFSEEYPLEFNVFSAPDGGKGISATHPIGKAEAGQLESFIPGEVKK